MSTSVGDLPWPAPTPPDDGSWWGGDSQAPSPSPPLPTPPPRSAPAPASAPSGDGGVWWGGPPAPPVFTPMTRAETRVAEEARDRRNAESGAGTITERLRRAWNNLPSSEKTALKVGVLATAAIAVTATVIAIASKK